MSESTDFLNRMYRRSFFNDILGGKTKRNVRIETILMLVRGAISKINIERQHGMNYRHAEVEWLLEQKDEVEALISELRGLRK